MSAREGLIDFLVNYGGHCRDCADEDGFCPLTGIGCGQRRKAAEFILGAIGYGVKHGFSHGYRLIGPGELDRETIERCRHATREAVLNLSPSMRKNGDILDDALFHALLSLQGGEDA